MSDSSPTRDLYAVTRHANELPERLEAAIGTGWVDRDEDPPDYDVLLADAAATIRQLATLAAALRAATSARDTAWAEVDGLRADLATARTVVQRLVDSDATFGAHTKDCDKSPCTRCVMHADVQTVAFKRAKAWLASVVSPLPASP